jgi:thioredoxin 1|tara:strand:+ start:3884 stop:4213 length:330 start_codon:yes stop_codon:yes gene_type:complete
LSLTKKLIENFMAKFGEIIGSNIPVLIDFYTDWKDTSDDLHSVLRDVAAALGDKAKVIKIDVDKNEILANALRIKGNPTFIIYKEGEMKWRQTGEQDANTLINLVEQYV